MSTSPDLATAMRRGVLERCPTCGEGRLYRKYLKVQDCPACGAPNTERRADDLPAYATILLVGHLVIAPLLVFPFIWTWPVGYVLLITLIPLAALSLLLLPRIKGAVVGLQTVLANKHAAGAPRRTTPPR